MALELYDSDFLLALDKYPHRETFCRIIALNWDEDPVAEITANVQSGSISVDGSSTVRRTCSLQLVTDSLKIDTIVWRYQTKIKVYIGLKNHLKYLPEFTHEHPTWANYDDIIWFPQGTFVITQFNSTSNNNGYNISLQAKDKMCLLDGSVGGNLWASHEFSIVWTYLEDGTMTKEYIPIYDIIKETIHAYAFEPYDNIIINDLDTCGVELIEYTGTEAAMYVFRQRLKSDDPDHENVWTDQIAFDITSGPLVVWFEERTSDTFNGNYEWTHALTKDSGAVEYLLQKKVTSTDVDRTVGYRATDLTYPGELTIPVGGTITDLLKKICDMLGEFEFFYDLAGRFVFQRKKIYVNSVWTNTIYDGTFRYYDNMVTSTNLAYDFVQGTIIESFSNSPQLNKIKNDYSVWGKRKTATGKEFNVHLRYAIDKKPTIYHSLLEGQTYISTDFHAMINGNLEKQEIITGAYDWRHLIYLMAKDNLRASGNIIGLQKALAKGYYHYNNFAEILEATNDGTTLDQHEIYRYDTLNKKFSAITTRKELLYCKRNKIFLYGPESNFYASRMSDAFVQYMNEVLGYDVRLAELGPPWFTGDRNKKLEGELKQQYQLEVAEDHGLRYEIEEWQRTFNTGYESYYADVLEFWPALYKTKEDYVLSGEDPNTGNYIDSYKIEGFNTVFIEIDDKGEKIEVIYDNSTLVNNEDYNRWGKNGCWNPDLFWLDHRVTDGQQIYLLSMINPEAMRFWIDFLDVDNAQSYGYVQDDEYGNYVIDEEGHYVLLSGTDRLNYPAGTHFYTLSNNATAETLSNDLAQYSVRLIGRRTKHINDDKVTSIYFRDTPSLLFVSKDFDPVEGEENLNYTRINIAPPISNYFKISSQGKSAKEVLDSLLYEGTYSQESISLSTIPIYYLQPNTRIGVHDDSTNISGEYIIKSFSIPLAYDGMMSISANRVVDRII